MASYRNTLFLLTCVACLGLTSRPGRCEVEPAWVERPADTAIAQIATPERVEPASIVLEVAQAEEKKQEEKKESKPKPKKSSGLRFSKSLLVLGLGAVIVTAGAVFILIKLMSPPDEEEEEETPPEAPEAISEAIPQISNPFIPPIPPQPVQVVTPNQPTRIQTDEPPPNLEISASGNNGYRDMMMSPTEPIDAPRPTPPEPEPIADTARYPNYDTQTQLLYQLQHRDPHIRSKAIWELGQQGDSRAIQPLTNLLIDSDSKQRSLILAALSEISSRAFKPLNRALTFSLQDENAEVRKNAIRDLSRIYDLLSQMSQIVQRATDDPDPEVQETARWALDKLSRIRPGSRE